MTRKLEGKIALITGGNSGNGLATAREFVAEISGRLPTTIDDFVAKHREAFVGTAATAKFPRK